MISIFSSSVATFPVYSIMGAHLITFWIKKMSKSIIHHLAAHHDDKLTTSLQHCAQTHMKLKGK